MKSEMDEEKQNSKKEACSLDIVQLDSSDDDFLFDDSETIDLMNDADKLALEVKKHSDLASLQDSFPKGLEEDEGDIDSDEEKDILKGIRDEIEGKVREEMKDELQVYQTRLLAIEAGELPEMIKDDRNEANDTETSEMDPKLKEAIVKMRKLDRILTKKVKREREVKRDRLILEKRLRDEISQMQHGAKLYKDIKLNTEKFLALAAPPSHNEGVSLDYEEAEDIPPLFQTQIDDCEIKRRERKSSVKNDTDKEEAGDSSQSKTPSEDEKNRSESSASGESRRNKSNKKDFIKRNKELAAAANDVIAMTDDEKKRLQDLLGDIDELEELDENCSVDGTESSVYQLALNPGDGFIPDDIELKSLTSIDEKLKHIMPEDEYLSISSMPTSQYSTPRPTLFTRVGVRSTANLLDGFGEQVLYETKEERELKARLDSIEKKLEMFKAPNETETDRSDYHLSDQQLDELLNQCARSMSRASVMDTPDTTARSEVSSRQMLLENPPKLSDEQLQQLLSEAYFPMSSQLAALEEDIGEDESAISAETWKTIMDERLDDSDNETNSIGNQNKSQNARGLNKGQYNGSYKYDNLLSGREELRDYNFVNGSQNDPSSPHFKSMQRSMSKEFKSLPKISSSSSLTRQSSSASESMNHGTSVTFKQNNESLASADPLRLPSISSNSFLIHASQGLNNQSSISRDASMNELIPMVHNNLSDMSLTSFSEDNWDHPQNSDRQNSHRMLSPHVPRPPSTSQ